MANPVVLVVGDPADCRQPLRDRGFDVLVSAGLTEAVTLLETNPGIDAIVTDMNVQGGSIAELLDHVHKLTPEVGVIVITQSGDVAAGVEAIKKGAADYLHSPPNVDELGVRLRRLISQRDLARENQFLRKQVRHSHASPNSLDLREATRAFERRHILQVLKQEGENKAKAAQSLGIGLSSLYRKLDDLDIRNTDSVAMQRP